MSAGVKSANAVTITVPSVPLWTDTGIRLRASETVTVHDARGQWDWGFALQPFGPEGDPLTPPEFIYDEWITNGRHGQLIGFIGDNPYAAAQNDPRLFPIGTGSVGLSGKSGELWLGFNDDFATNATFDNVGSVIVGVDAPASHRLEPNSARLHIVGGSDQATLASGQCVTLAFELRFSGSAAYVDVTQDVNTSFVANPQHDIPKGAVFCARASDAGKVFTVYGRYRDPVTGVTITDTVIIHVLR